MKHKKLLATLLTIVSILAMNISVMASAGYITVHLWPNQEWTDRYDNPGTRTGNFSYVEVICHSVYPESGTDNYSRMQVRLADMYGNALSDTYTIKEGSQVNRISLWEGSLSIKDIYYQFRGNSREEAYALVSYTDK
ncbi:MAG: hypothetical protein NC094_13705 [Bacteroidales bacterium]|nr:hypothetical protein [Lachnoclostridium sp.]MCM1385593.1 hypothetical protein [Lachnoclostridium sp.]MCM1466456.1 hypothetical protein [Bacteroidales bacterium]